MKTISDVSKKLGYVTAVLGVISSIAVSVVLGVNVITGERNMVATILYLLAGLFGTAIITCILITISEMSKYLDAVYENTLNAKEQIDEIAEELEKKN